MGNVLHTVESNKPIYLLRVRDKSNYNFLLKIKLQYK